MLNFIPPPRLLVGIFVLCAMFFSCEKEEAHLAGDELPLNEGIKYDAIPQVTLQDLDVSVTEDRLVFADLMEFAKARNAISTSSQPEIDAWHSGLGFKSMHSAYREWADALPVDASAMTVDLPAFAYRSGKAEVSYDINSYSLVNADLANSSGEFLIGSELHKVTMNRHIHVPSGDASLIPFNADRAVTDASKGIYVKTYDPLEANDPSSTFTKDVDRDLRTCPTERLDRDFSNQLRLESRDESNGRRMIGGIVLTSVDSKNGDNVNSITFSAEAYIRNQKKSGLIWKADYVSSTIKDNPSFRLLRRPLGQLSPNTCPGSTPCPDDQFTVFDDGVADFTGFTKTTSGEYNTIIFDQGIYTSSGLRNQPTGIFSLKDLRYDLLVGRAQMQRLNPQLDTEIGCSNN